MTKRIDTLDGDGETNLPGDPDTKQLQPDGDPEPEPKKKEPGPTDTTG